MFIVSLSYFTDFFSFHFSIHTFLYNVHVCQLFRSLFFVSKRNIVFSHNFIAFSFVMKNILIISSSLFLKQVFLPFLFPSFFFILKPPSTDCGGGHCGAVVWRRHATRTPKPSSPLASQHFPFPSSAPLPSPSPWAIYWLGYLQLVCFPSSLSSVVSFCLQPPSTDGGGGGHSAAATFHPSQKPAVPQPTFPPPCCQRYSLPTPLSALNCVHVKILEPM